MFPFTRHSLTKSTGAPFRANWTVAAESLPVAESLTPGAEPLPIATVLPAVGEALSGAGTAVVVAPPGAGKTTRLPLALLDSGWRRNGRILVLEPRRIAARAAAQQMARLLRESVGERVGYRVRHESRVGSRTVIEVVTEGILTRMIQDDPSLDGVAAVLFDEFHERSLDADDQVFRAAPRDRSRHAGLHTQRLDGLDPDLERARQWTLEAAAGDAGA